MDRECRYVELLKKLQFLSPEPGGLSVLFFFPSSEALELQDINFTGLGPLDRKANGLFRLRTISFL